MCGRGKAASAEDVRQVACEIARSSETSWSDSDLYRNYPNIYPGKRLGIVIKNSESLFSVRSSYWGLVPSVKNAEAKDAFNLFNARSETVMTKSTFRNAFHTKYGGRAVAVLDGFYEWVTENKIKQPHFVCRADRQPLMVAALCSPCKDSDDTSCTLLTRDVVPSLAWLHDRMPLILPDVQAARNWIENSVFQGLELPNLQTHMVSTAMNKLAYQEVDAATPIKPNLKLTAFFPRRSEKPISSSTKKRDSSFLNSEVVSSFQSSATTSNTTVVPVASNVSPLSSMTTKKVKSPSPTPAKKKKKPGASAPSSSPRITDFFKKQECNSK
mmetsp:Transcript_14913/g.22458  ORF Transcript_14913/g.22458 Transcript_14913/m.22458 type:complete len:327 (+) Transcript_14913:239-1219(+)